MDSFDINDVLRLGEHHKGWIHLYPTGFDFDVVDGNDAKCCIWFNGMWKEKKMDEHEAMVRYSEC